VLFANFKDLRTSADRYPELMSAERGASVRFPPPLVFLASLGVGLAVRLAGVPASLPVDRTPRLALGALLVAAAIGLVGSARIRFLRTGQSPIPWTPTPQLIIAGPYRITRNPMYVGVTLLQIGLGVLLDNAWSAGLALVSLLVVHFIAVLPEERYLGEKFAGAYEEYRARVRRYL
jgi:protein-S-isoprenylcysteine O-methyltransferase Ste14